MPLRKGVFLENRTIEESSPFFDDDDIFSDNNSEDKHRMITIILVLSSFFGVLLILASVFAFCPNKNKENSATDVDTVEEETENECGIGHDLEGDENMKLWLNLLEKRRMGFIRQSIDFEYLQKHGAKCGICRVEIANGEKVGYSVSNDKCKHVFHPKCLTRWLLNHKSCPVCHNQFWDDGEPTSDSQDGLNESVEDETWGGLNSEW